MAIDYLTLEEVCETLSKTPDEVKAMVADGRLSEVRDGGKAFFKKSEVDQIAAKEGSSIVDLALTDEADVQETSESFASALSNLADSSSGTGLLDEVSPAEPAAPAELETPAAGGSGGLPEISLEDLPEELPAAPREEEEAAAADLSGSHIELAPAEEAPAALDEGSAAAIPDLGMSGSSILGLDAEEPAAKPQAKEESKPGKVGISVFDDDELPIAADPMGETQISAGVPELEAVGSGSGLLDLTREKDDTSLGAELLDVISPSEAGETETEGEAVEVAEAAETVEDSAGEVVEAVESGEAAAVVEEETPVLAAPRKRAPSAMKGAVPLNVCAGLGLLGLAVAALATAGAIQGVWPSFLSVVARDIPHFAAFGGLAVVAVGAGIYGIMADRPK